MHESGLEIPLCLESPERDGEKLSHSLYIERFYTHKTIERTLAPVLIPLDSFFFSLDEGL